MRRMILVVIIFFAFTAGNNSNDKAFAASDQPQNQLSTEQAKDLVNKTLYFPLRDIKYFTVEVYMGTNCESLGLKREAIEDYLKLRIKNNFNAIPVLTEPDIEKKREKDKTYSIFEDPTIGYISVTLLAVGTDYPIAGNAEITVGVKDNWHLYSDQALGISSKESLEGQMKQAIDNMVEHFAITFYKVRDEI